MSVKVKVHSNGVEDSVKVRYAEAAKTQESELCCPITYESKYLAVIPEEIIEKDYGCGDPSEFLKQNETVLDLGCGAGKLCFIASQIVGPKGKVIGVDFNPAMLELARKYQNEVGNRIGWHNVEFKRAKIQDLTLDLDRVEEYFRRPSTPIKSLEDYEKFQLKMNHWRQNEPAVSDESVDVIISNCVLNLVRTEDKRALFKEMYRVLKRGGRVAISDIVSDESVPKSLQDDPKLWSGCISGAFQESEFIQAFEEAGFYGIQIEKWNEKPWRTVQGIEFRSVTLTAYKGKEGPCLERNQAVIYKGPWKKVEDDDHHILKRGVRTAVCDKTFQIFSKPPYGSEIVLIPAIKEVNPEKAKAFDCLRSTERHPRETKGMKYRKTTSEQAVCDPDCC